MSQKLLVGGFKWFENNYQFNKDFLEKFNEESHEGYFLQVYVQYTQELHNLHNNLPFLT